jgi:hypothetical protein
MAKKEEIQKKAVEDVNKSISEQLNLVQSLQDSMNDLLKIYREKGSLDKLSLDNVKAIASATKAMKSEYDSVKEVQKDIAKNTKLQNDVERQTLALYKKGGDALKEELTQFRNQEASLKKAEASLSKFVKLQQQGVQGADELVAKAQENLEAQQQSLAFAEAILTPEAEQVRLLEQAAQINRDNNGILEEQLRTRKNLENAERGLVKLTENLGKVFDKIGASGIGKVFSDAAEKSKKLIYEATNGGQKQIGVFGKMKIAATSFGAALKVALGPMALLGMLVSGFQKFKERAEEAKNLLAEMSQQTMDFGRNLGMSSSMANKVAGSAKAIGGAMGMTREQSVASAEAIYGQIGGVEKLSDKTMKTFMKLNVHGGVSAETIGRMYTMSKLTGASAGLVAKNIANQAQESIKNLKVNVSMKQVMEGVSKVSNRMLLSSGGYSKSITTAVVQAKKLGLEMDQIESIANSLLNIEDSIAAEMEAELLTGKELNLEKAREAALNGNNAKLMEALAEQGITAADYGNMNRIQQESLSKALGLSSEEMAKMLVTQKQNETSNQDLLDTQHKGIDAMTTQASLAESIKNLNESILLSNKDGGEAALKWEETMARFRKTVEPLLNMIFIPILDTMSFIVEKITAMIQGFVNARKEGLGVWDAMKQVWSQADGISKILIVVAGTIAAIRAGQIAINIAMKAYTAMANVVKGIQTAIKIAQGIQLGYQAAMGSMEAKKSLDEKKGLARSLGTAMMKVVASLSTIPVAGVALGIAAAAGLGAMVYKYMNDGVISPKSGGGGYGDRVLYGPEGAIAFNNKDTIVAGTNLFGNDVASGPDAGKASGGGGPVVAELQRVSALLQQILSKEGAVMIDGNKVGTTLALSNYKQQ